ncbi:MAG: hypothetical protein VYE73_10485 [Acidobacteriota bacterium]|nr:hypothetical protein [Acidobacteriota bacterium]
MERRESIAETLERSMQEAQWRLGALLLDPYLSVRDIGYIDEGEPFGSDVTATAGVGLRGYLPIGNPTTVAIHALPEYSAYFDNSERNQLNFSYGVGLFSNYGRIGLELSARQEERDDFFSGELNRRVTNHIGYGVVSFEVDLGRGVSLFGAAEPRRYEYSEPIAALGVTFVDQERDEELLRAGFRLELPRGLSIALGVEDSAADFDSSTNDRSNSGVAPLLQFHYDAHPFYFDANLALRELEPEVGSRFVAYDEESGDFGFAWRTSPRWQLQVFGRSNLVYSLDPTWVYYQDDALGIAAELGLSSNTSVRLFYERGNNDYTGGESATTRNEDLDSVGGTVRVHFGRGIVLQASARETEYSAVDAGLNRSFATFTMGLTFGSKSGAPWG